MNAPVLSWSLIIWPGHILTNLPIAAGYLRAITRNLVLAFKKFQDMGKLEIVTCGATHGYFPLMDVAKSSIRAQVKTAVSQYEKVFGRPPRGIWLPSADIIPGTTNS